MITLESFTDVIRLWPTLADFAQDIGVEVTHAQTIKNRNSIPAKYWWTLTKAAKKRGLKIINIETLARLASIEDGFADRRRETKRKNRITAAEAIVN